MEEIGESNLDQLRALSDRLAETESELEEAHARYQNFIQNSTEGIWRTELRTPVPIDLSADEQLNMIFSERSAYLAEANERMAEMYGLALDDLIQAGSDIDNLLPIEENYEYLKNFIENDYRSEDELSVEKAGDGSVKYFRNSMVGVIEDGYLVRVWGVQRDVTDQYLAEVELRRQQEIYKLIVHNIGELLALINLDGIILFASPSYKTVLGWTGEEMVGMNAFDLVHRDDLEKAQEAFSAAQKSKHAVVVNLRLRRKTGRYVTLESVGVAVRDNGELEMVLSIGRAAGTRTVEVD